ncbi:hypothetical protein EDD11_006600 [Mortierella claussenii]|nr:hypothetical protein EDD11_006600 [Mortierella claussenii]
MSTDLISYSKPMLSNSKDGMCEDLKKCIEVCMDHVTMMYKECKGQYDMDGYGDMTGNMCWMAKRLCREGCERQMSWKESKEDLKHVKHSEKFKSKAGKAVAQSVIKQLNHDRN